MRRVKGSLISNLTRCAISHVDRSTINDRLTGNQLRPVRRHMKRSPLNLKPKTEEY